ncbi:hypothetical protein [Rhizobium sp. SGZ-381]|uniref:hypothetical protein n=1 Tax=Rhizobium sp. SGZ-381 TaxID=3342800 RepID=UPI00366EE2D7
MTRAICIRCGEVKHGCWTPCRACGHAPHGETELADSLCLSDQMMDDREDMDAVAEYIRDNRIVPVFPAGFRHALAAVRKAKASLTRRGLLPADPDTFVSALTRREIP